ncbi:DNA polymerase III subunit beta [Candidatus Shapirobacteria bacterium RBG_13_44_7]|uniref:Beta sliding clamp n=1 Tax=Candidatus Shapirobacteria bacterium RBG_13_44_7 TaxID=1802149 RepID=A0A1F7SEN4_9BACT|nr:MAG: DNA polymerase III subunit beta [Candidatus Shapirobacteria bacterium RBG_13_44_7]
MKLSLLQENLNVALQNLSRFTTAKSQLPILGNILLATDQGRLKLSATNLELGLNCWIGAKISKEGTTTLPAREIAEYVSYLPPGKIDLQLDDKNLLHLTSPKSQSSFTTIPPADFPVLPSINPKTSLEIDLSLIQNAISQVAFAAATDDSRPVLTAVLSRFTLNELILAATDGFRLSLKNLKLVNPLELKGVADGALTYLIPARALSEVIKLSRSAKKITLGPTTDDHQIVFVLDDLELVSRLLEGDFPDYQRIIPESHTTKIFLDREEFTQSLKIASVFARESANVVRFKIKKSSLELSANAPQIGQNQVTLDSRLEGEPLEIAFNYKFVSDFLSVCQGKEIAIELNEALTPGFFQDTSDPSFTHIIMPVRLQD